MNIFGFAAPDGLVPDAESFLMRNIVGFGKRYGIKEESMSIRFDSAASHIGFFVGSRNEPLLTNDDTPISPECDLTILFHGDILGLGETESLGESLSVLWRLTARSIRHWVNIYESRMKDSLVPPSLLTRTGHDDLMDHAGKNYVKFDWSEIRLRRYLDAAFITSVIEHYVEMQVLKGAEISEAVVSEVLFGRGIPAQELLEQLFVFTGPSSDGPFYYSVFFFLAKPRGFFS